MFSITERISYLEEKTAEMQAFLKSAPEGSLVCRYSKQKRWRYFRSDHEKQEYIHKSNRDLAVKLALKKLFKKMIISAEKEKTALTHLSSVYGRYEKDIFKFFSDNPGCASLIQEKAADSNVSDRVKAWKQEEYKKNPYYPEYLTHKTLKGEKVRSKSEAFIADVLYLAGIPYRYECQLVVGGDVFYPDFMIMDPSTGEIYIWEHFGLMDTEKYIQRTVYKISAYTSAGFFPNKNFIITYEDNLHPFTAVQATEAVSRHFNRDITSYQFNNYPI